MNSKYLCGVMMILLSLFACSKKTAEFLDAPLISVWEPDKTFSTSYAMSAINVYNDTVIYPTKAEKDYFFAFTDLGGTRIKDIKVPIGKGPGEMLGHMSISVLDDKIIIYDSALSKILVYSTEGQHYDDFSLDTSIGVPMSITVSGTMMYINGKYDNKIIKYDLEKNAVVKGLKYESNKTSLPAQDDIFEGGVITVDLKEKMLYLGYYNKPFRLERYDMDMNLIDTLTVPDNTDYKTCTWHFADSNTPTQFGDRVIGGIVFDEKYAYASFGGGYDLAINNPNFPYEYRPAVVRIQVFDKKSGKYITTIACKELEGLRGFIKVLSVTEKSIVLLIADMSEVTYTIMGKKREEKQARNFAIAVLKNPLYDPALLK